MPKERTEAECFEILYKKIKGLNIREIYKELMPIFIAFAKKRATCFNVKKLWRQRLFRSFNCDG